MTIIMTLLVRNEADIVARNVEYHLQQGVDFIIAMDNASIDGTTDILREYEKSGVLRLLFQDKHNFDQAVWVTQMARMAYRDYGADWIINNDADEFCWPETGTLKSVLEDCQGKAVVVTRFNFLSSIKDGDWIDTMIYRDVPSINLLGKRIPPNTIHRGRDDVTVGLGNHRVWFGWESPPTEHLPLCIFHFPHRTFAQFERKVKLTGEARSRNPWLLSDTELQRWYKIYQAGKLADYYADCALESAATQTRIKSGEVIIDTRFRDYVRGREIDRTGRDKVQD